MISDKYLKQIKRIITAHNQNGKNKYFIFGSSVKEEKFGDVDIGVIGEASREDLAMLKGAFTESSLPYKIDIVKIDDTSNSFKNNVLKGEIIWIAR
jgi:hypothetical protein